MTVTLAPAPPRAAITPPTRIARDGRRLVIRWLAGPDSQPVRPRRRRERRRRNRK